jgi:mannosyltransferase
MPVNIAIKDEGNSPSNSEWPLGQRAALITIALLFAAAAGLRFFYLARKPFWFDECFSVEVARLSWHDLGRLLWRREANMSLYYLLLRGWLHFGSSPFFVRSLSAIISLATLQAIFWLARKLFDRRVALLAVALMTFNAYHIRYAQEARSYSLLVLLATLSSGFFVATLREPTRRHRWGYILASVLAVYAHLYALLLLAAQWLSARKRASPQPLRRAWTWIGVASLPLVIFAAKTGAGPIRWIRRPGLSDLVDFAEHFAGNSGVALLPLYAAACCAAIMPLGKVRRLFRAEVDGTEADWSEDNWDVWRLRFLLIWLAFPPALTVLLSLARPLFLGRYFIFCLPALVILAAAGLAKLRPAWLSAVALAAMLLLSLQGIFSYYDHDFDLERDGMEAATNYVLDRAQPGDAILFHIAEVRAPYEFFKSMRVTGAPITGPEIIYPRHGDRLDYRDFTGKPCVEFVQSASAQYSRLWVVLMSNGTPGHPDSTTLMLDQTLGKSFSQIERVQFPQVEVRLYSRP